MFNEKLSERCRQLSAANNSAQRWIKENSEIVQDPHRIGSSLRKSARRLKRIEKSLSKPMSVGVFGPSQAGKSYLLSTIAKGKDGKLIADFNGEMKNFLSDINPQGGRESTGLVTRFTMKSEKSPFPDFPVQLELLSEIDLVKILANTYFTDCKSSDEPADKQIASSIARLKEEAIENVEQPLTEDDVEELRDYCNTELSGSARLRDLSNAYWDEAIRLAPKLPLQKRVDLYSIIWDEILAITEILRATLSFLEKLGFPEKAYAQMTALVPREKSIIDVEQLYKLQDQSTLKMKSLGGSAVNMPLWVAAAITAELQVKMKESPGVIFDHTDLLDFPGYRSRFKFQNIKEELSQDGAQEKARQMFLRGKVAYLFQRYSRNRELTCMLLCVAPGNQEVKDLPVAIDKWVKETHGKSEEDRTHNAMKDSLFLILTKADMHFQDNEGLNNDWDQRWNNLITASIDDYFANGFSWPLKWRNGKKFQNTFLLRNPNIYWESVMVLDNESKEEQRVRPEKEEFIRKLKSTFLRNKKIKDFFEDPERSWEAIMSINDGGIGYIKEKLEPLCEKQIKENQLNQALETEVLEIESMLAPYYKSDDKEGERQKKEQIYRGLIRNFSKTSSGVFRSHLWELLYRFRVTPDELKKLVRKAESRKEAYQNEEKEEENKAENNESLDDLIESIINPGSGKVIHKDFSTFYAEIVLSYWCNKIKGVARDVEMQHYYGLTEELFVQLVTELETAVLRLKAKETLEEKFREIAAPGNVSQDKKRYKQASLASSYINNFISWLGFEPDGEHNEIMLGKGSRRFFQSKPEVEGFPVLPEAASTDSHITTHFVDWSLAFYKMMLDNVNFDGKSSFDAEQNKLLGKILSSLRNE